MANANIAAKQIKQTELSRLNALAKQLASQLADVKKTARKSASDDPDRKHAVELAKQLSDTSSKITCLEMVPDCSINIQAFFANMAEFWKELFPSERNRLVSLLVERITVRDDGIDIEVKTSGIASLADEFSESICNLAMQQGGQPNESGHHHNHA
jgi:site-specific DNA recombinase